MMFLDGYIAAPPTITVFCAKEALVTTMAKAKNAADKNFWVFIILFF
jgi:hypothetical protein